MAVVCNLSLYIPFYIKWKRRREFRRAFQEWKTENYPNLSDQEAIKIFLKPIIEVMDKIKAMLYEDW